MTRPTVPSGPPYPEGEDPYPADPGYPGPPQHPEAGYPAPPYPQPGYPAPEYPQAQYQEPQYQEPHYQAPEYQEPYPAEPPAPQQPPQPTFTPHPKDGPRHGKPRPTFTPHEGNEGRRSAPAPTVFMQPAPAGYPQPSFQPYDLPEAAPPRPGPRQAPARPGPGPGDGQAPPPDSAGGRTRVLERGPDGLPVTGPQRAFDSTSPNLARSSKAMAIGTIVSRGTGFLRTLVLVAALGQQTLADAYNNSNTLPNTVYYLMLGGIFTSVVVPMLVRAAKEDPDRGQGYAKRIYSLGVVSLLTVTVLGTALAGPIVDLYAGNLSDAGEHRVMVTFAYFFIPQIFFYGMDSLLGAILNVRGRFGPNMWTPVINNVVVIVVGLLFMVTAKDIHADTVSGFGVALLGIGTTLGILIQSICLFPIMWRVGFDMRLTFDFRRHEISEIGRMSGWMFGFVATQWLGNLVVQRVANAAANSAAHLHPAVSGVGYSAYSYAWQLFQLPYAIVGISVISALLPRMSGHATDRRYSLVRDDFSKGVRVASVIVVPAAVFLGVLGAPLCEFLFSVGKTHSADARYIGEVFGAFSIGLVPFMFTQLQLRVFYSFRENRAPALLGMIMLIVNVIGALVVLKILPPSQTVIGLAFAYDIMTLAGAVIAWPMLLRRVGSLDGWRITQSLVKMLVATIPGLIFALVAMAVVGSFLHAGPLYGFVTIAFGGGGALVLYAICCRALKVEEFRTLMRSVAGRLGR